MKKGQTRKTNRNSYNHKT